MDTQRLRTIQAPRHTLYLLEAFACDRLGVSSSIQRLTHLQDLPHALRRHVGSGPDQHYVWFAWRVDERTHLLAGAMSLSRSRERGRPVLEIHRYGDDGLLVEAAAWLRVGTDHWERCEW